MKLIAELKRRNVIRMAGLYLVGAWLITQVAATLLPTFDAPSWVMKVLVVVLALGFLTALLFSWLYELTPEGLKRDSEVDPAKSIAPQTAQRMDRLIFALQTLLRQGLWRIAELSGVRGEDRCRATLSAWRVWGSALRCKASK